MINRPKANAIDAATSRGLYQAVDQFESDDNLRVAIITGAGSKFFSAGWDLTTAATETTNGADHGPGGFAGLTQLFDLRKPILAAVNGSAHGGGLELILATHLSIASEDARFSFPEARLGLLADAGGVIRLPRRVPRPIALELLLTGRVFTAGEAHRWGLVNRVVPADRVLAEAMQIARHICQASPRSVAAILDIAESTQALDDEQAFAAASELGTVAQLKASGDGLEGARAFEKKRPAQWQK